MIIGLGHKKRMGKDTFATILIEEAEKQGLKIKRGSFAEKLYSLCHELYGWAGQQDKAYYEIMGEAKEIVLPAIGKTPRQILIEVGNHLRSVYIDTWLAYTLNASENLMVITDVRYPNEARAIKESGGLLIRITRPGVELGSDVADTALDGYVDWDLEVENSGTIEDLRIKALEVIRNIKNDY